MTIDDLYVKEGWVVLTFPDGTRRAIRTTFNVEVLNTIPGGIKEGMLYDLESGRWTSLPKNPEVLVDVQENKPEFSEVEQFVNRFV